MIAVFNVGAAAPGPVTPGRSDEPAVLGSEGGFRGEGTADSCDCAQAGAVAQVLSHTDVADRLLSALASTCGVRIVLARCGAAVAHWPQVLENTQSKRLTAPTARFSCAQIPSMVSGVQVGHCASVSARLASGFQRLHSHPSPIETARGGSQSLSNGAETMKTLNAGTPGAAAASSGYVPPHYLRRLARQIVLRSALRGRLSWHVALPLLAMIDGRAA